MITLDEAIEILSRPKTMKGTPQDILEAHDMAITALRQPEHLTDDDFETIRIHLSAFKESLCNQRRWKEAEDYERLISRFMSFASSQSKIAQNISDGDLISRQAAIDELRYAQHKFVVADEAGGLGTVKWSENVIFWGAAKRVLEDLPSSQPEIVRCKDCEHNRLPATSANADCEIFYGMTDQNGFCHMAERRTDDQTCERRFWDACHMRHSLLPRTADIYAQSCARHYQTALEGIK